MNRPTISTAVTALAIPMLVAALMAAKPVRAAPISYGTGLASPALTIDFSGLSDNTPIGSTYAGQGVTFGGLFANSTQGNTLGNTTAPAAGNFIGDTVNATFTIGFSAAVADAAFFLYTDGFGTTITSSLAGATVESVSAGTYQNNAQNFFGFTGSNFDLITISVAGTGLALIDDVQVGSALPLAVPEPGSAIIFVGLAGMLAFGNRRRT